MEWRVVWPILLTKTSNVLRVVVKLIMGTEPRTYAREVCPTCTYRSVAIIKIADSRVCSLCYELVRKASKLDLDGVQALTLIQFKEYIDKSPKDCYSFSKVIKNED